MKLTDKQKKGLAAIMALDLTEVVELAMRLDDRLRKRSGIKLVANTAERGYRCYLALRLLYPDRTIAPMGRESAAVDALWHAHVLDTRRYAADCQTIFGEYLHHTPGIVPDEAMMMLYLSTFTPSAWGEHDPAMTPFMYDSSDYSDLGPADGHDGEDCA